MSNRVIFKFRFSGHAGVQRPLVYIWVDRNDDGAGTGNERVALARDGLEWVGEAVIPGKTVAGVAFLVAYQGAVGANWSLTVTPADEEKKILCQGSGPVEKARDAFWGVLSAGEPA